MVRGQVRMAGQTTHAHVKHYLLPVRTSLRGISSGWEHLQTLRVRNCPCPHRISTEQQTGRMNYGERNNSCCRASRKPRESTRPRRSHGYCLTSRCTPSLSSNRGGAGGEKQTQLSGLVAKELMQEAVEEIGMREDRDDLRQLDRSIGCCNKFCRKCLHIGRSLNEDID